jgi:hypothetical protein
VVKRPVVKQPVVERVAMLVLSGVVCSLAAYLGAWWVPFLVGVAAGLLGVTGRFARGGVLAAMVGAAGGWAVLLWAMALAGLPAGATAHVIAALAGLPPYAAVAVAATLLLAALQVLVGAWLARAVTPRKAGRPAVTEESQT